MAAAVLVMLAVPFGSVMLYLSQGRPDLPDAPLSSRSAERARMAEIAESRRGLAEMATDLERGLADQPDDGDGWLRRGCQYGWRRLPSHEWAGLAGGKAHVANPDLDAVERGRFDDR